MRWSLAFLMLAACHFAHNTTSLDHDESDLGTEFHVIGATKHVDSYWGGVCSNNSMFDKSNKYGSEPCNVKPFTLAVTCRGCQVKVADAGLGSATADITFTELGPLRIHAISTRTDNGDTREVESKQIVVTMPDHVELGCDPHDPCGPEGVSARDPQIYPRVSFHNKLEYTTALLINGKAIGGYSFGVSLVQLYPDAKDERGGVRPGVYDVDLAIGNSHNTWHVVAH